MKGAVTVSLILCLILDTVSPEHSYEVFNHHMRDAITSFYMDLFKTVLSEKEGNVIISPLSLSILLAILHQGALGDTEHLITKVLNIDQNLSKLEYGSLTRYLKGNSNATIEFANGAFLMKGYHIESAFKDVLNFDFLADIDTIDFGNNEEAAKIINHWVSQHTHDRIQALVHPDIFSEFTRLVLINTIFFKAAWKIPFRKDSTNEELFYVKKDVHKFVPMMHITQYLRIGNLENRNSRWLEIPFQGDRFSLLFVLPINITDDTDLVNSFDVEDLLSIMLHLNSTKTDRVRVSLPRFKVSTETDLVPVLKKFGLGDLFDVNVANFGGIAEGPLCLSEVIQKAEMEVDEDGAEASGATVLRLRARSITFPVELDFIADHPFLVFIIDKATKLPLFCGRVIDPASS